MMRRICVGLLVIAICVTMLPYASASADGALVARCNLRLRKQANSKSDTLATVPGGLEISPLGRSGGWTKISYQGHVGYVSTDYLMELTRSGYYPLREGDNNPYVGDLEKRLISLGYMTGTANNEYDAVTKSAVIEFQRVNNMKADGLAGGETQKALFANTALSAVGAVQTDTSGNPVGGTVETATNNTTTGTPSSTTLRKGDRGDAVKSLQGRLIELGYLSGKADGVFGSGTEKAVEAFQKRSSLTVDGKAGKVTQNLLYSTGATLAPGAVPPPTATPAPTETATNVTYKTLKRGITSNDVKKLQERLKDLGYLSANATGYYGSATQAAIEKFQRANNISVDGIAGSATQNLLYGTTAKSDSGTGTTVTQPETKSYATLREGMKSSAVTTLQKKLRDLGYLKENATGYYGSATKKAVTAFQKANRLSADGIAGNLTQNMLYNGGVASAGNSNGSSGGGSGKISGPSASSVKLLHWFNSVKPSLKGNSVVQVYDPASGYGFKLKALSLGRHFDSEPLTAEDTSYMNAAFGNVTTWTPKTVWVQLPSGTWTLATMHNTPHLSGSVKNNNFDGHLCVHFLRDMSEASKNDPNYGVQHQKAIREAWKKLTGQVIN